MKYLIAWIKSLIAMLIISGILIYIFPYKITVLIGVFFILCSFSVAKEDLKAKAQEEQNE